MGIYYLRMDGLRQISANISLWNLYSRYFIDYFIHEFLSISFLQKSQLKIL